MRKLSNDVYLALILLLIAGVVFWETSRLNPMSAVFPRTIGYVLLILSIYYLGHSLLKPMYEQAFANVDKQRVALICLFLIIYGFFIWLIGFLLASIIFIFTVVWYLQEKGVKLKLKLLRSSLCSLFISLCFYSLFKFVFIVPLPPGLIFS